MGRQKQVDKSSAQSLGRQKQADKSVQSFGRKKQAFMFLLGNHQLHHKFVIFLVHS